MPITIRTLIQGRDRPITISSTATVRDALEVMWKHEFTQLPVTEGDDVVLGLITSDSIVRAMGAFGVASEDLQVRDAMRPAGTFDPDDDFGDLLDALRDSYAAVVVGSDGKLMAIVTGFDTSEHFRRQFEDLMVVQDIETAIKEHVQFAFSRLQLSKTEEEAAIRRIGNPDDRVRTKVKDAITLYLEKGSMGVIDDETLERVTAEVTGKPQVITFDRLTLHQYCELLLSEQCWSVVNTIYGSMRQPILRTLLRCVQNSRNALAHFRGQLNPLDRSHLHLCADWFAQHPLPAIAAATVPVVVPTAQVDQSDVVPADEVIENSESRYGRLADWLGKRLGPETTVTATFDEIEVLLGTQLPRSAFAHRSWWANDSVSHPQSLNWLDVGWRVATVSLTNRVVTFARVEERQGAYIEFFAAALRELRARASWGVGGHSPSGANWQLLAGMTSEGRQIAILAWAFARRKRFRTELYIDSGGAEGNKRLFDSLLQQQVAIESRVGNKLMWERMDESRACRIAMYTDGSIQSSADRLATLRNWAVDAAIALHDVFVDEVRKRR